MKWLPILIWVAVICYLSFSSLEKVPIPTFFSADKIGHFAMYFILELLFLIPLKENFKGLKLASVFAILFAISTELIQHFFITNRYGEVMDLAANLSGTAAAYFILKRKINI